jgi:hypothetical protein
MEKYRKYLLDALIGIFCGLLIAMGVHRCNRQPIETKVERDTVIVTDTTVHYYPKPVEVEKTKTEYRWLTRVQYVGNTDTLTQHDSVLVEVPIESKHYHGEEYDAYISGYEPSLDSIKVYQRTQLITEIRTVSKPPNRWELDLVGGIDYNINGKKYTPHVGGELLYKPNRVQVGVQGGIQYDDKVEPYVGGKVKFMLF